jgi:hypothetical protein
MLRTAMGPAIAGAMADPLVLEMMVNPGGVLRLNRLGEGRGARRDSRGRQLERIVRLVANQARKPARFLQWHVPVAGVSGAITNDTVVQPAQRKAPLRRPRWAEIRAWSSIHTIY